MWTFANRRRCAWTLLGLLGALVAMLSCRQPGGSARNGEKAYPHRAIPARYDIGGYKFKYPAAENVKRSPEDLVAANATCIACHSASDGDTMHNGKLSSSNATVVAIS